MENIGQWAVSCCAAAAVCSAVLMLAPSEKQEKILRLTVSCFFLLCTVLPVIKLLPGLNSDVLYYSSESAVLQTQQTADEAIKRETVALLEKSAYKQLYELGCGDIAVKIEIGETDNEIYVQSIFIEIEQKDIDKAADISMKMYESFGCTPQIAQKE